MHSDQKCAIIDHPYIGSATVLPDILTVTAEQNNTVHLKNNNPLTPSDLSL